MYASRVARNKLCGIRKAVVFNDSLGRESRVTKSRGNNSRILHRMQIMDSRKHWSVLSNTDEREKWILFRLICVCLFIYLFLELM